MSKIGRNAPCPCNSGKKFKRCCGALQSDTQPIPIDLNVIEARLKAQTLQRENQQGLGKQIISTVVNGIRFVAVNNRLMQSKQWITFSDFLGDYIKIKIGGEWGNNEIRNKTDDTRHHILVWYQRLCLLQQKYRKGDGELFDMPVTGAVKAYNSLAYDLYCLDHDAKLQATLIERLKNPDQNFYGARYEVAVAAMMIRAGFTIEFEDESDRLTTHCEFSVVSKKTGRSFSVECKQLESLGVENKINLGKLGRRFVKAVSKEVKHTRIVFIDLNFPYDPKKNSDFPEAMNLALNHLRALESNKANGGHLPPAYVFLTNHPFHHHLDDINVGYALLAEGFKIPEFKLDAPQTLHDAIDIRERHIDLFHLMESIKKYSEIPSTFDGEIPEFAHNPELNRNRLLIGERYTIPNVEGIEVIGVLELGVVMEENKTASCFMRLDDNQRVLVSFDLSDEEMSAYRANRETFFGEINTNGKSSNNALDMYDFFYNTYKNSSKEVLLSFFSPAHDRNELELLSQPELARMYSEQCANFAMMQQPEQPKQ